MCPRQRFFCVASPAFHRRRRRQRVSFSTLAEHTLRQLLKTGQQDLLAQESFRLQSSNLDSEVMFLHFRDEESDGNHQGATHPVWAYHRYPLEPSPGCSAMLSHDVP